MSCGPVCMCVHACVCTRGESMAAGCSFAAETAEFESQRCNLPNPGFSVKKEKLLKDPTSVLVAQMK